MEATGILRCVAPFHTNADAISTHETNHEHKPFQPYAFARHELSRFDDAAVCKATLQDYQQHFDLNIGVYAPEVLHQITSFVNDHASIHLQPWTRFVNLTNETYHGFPPSDPWLPYPPDRRGCASSPLSPSAPSPYSSSVPPPWPDPS